jgi:hypothetical protein
MDRAPPVVFRISRTGSTRKPVIVIGPLAFKIARTDQGRVCNLYEAKLYRSTTEARRRLLCPVLWASRRGTVLIVAAAKPLNAPISPEAYAALARAWDYMPGEDGCPFEPKQGDWGWYRGRKVALDYSTPALDDLAQLS